jgi:hypothetical protein
MYLDYLTENHDTKENELKNSILSEDILKREGLDLNDLQNKN